MEAVVTVAKLEAQITQAVAAAAVNEKSEARMRETAPVAVAAIEGSQGLITAIGGDDGGDEVAIVKSEPRMKQAGAAAVTLDWGLKLRIKLTAAVGAALMEMLGQRMKQEAASAATKIVTSGSSMQAAAAAAAAVNKSSGGSMKASAAAVIEGSEGLMKKAPIVASE